MSDLLKPLEQMGQMCFLSIEVEGVVEELVVVVEEVEGCGDVLGAIGPGGGRPGVAQYFI